MMLQNTTLMLGAGSKQTAVILTKGYRNLCSVSGVDVDLNDGSLQKQYNDYINRIEQAKKLGLERHQVNDQLDLLL